MKNIHTIYYEWDKPKIEIIEKFGITVKSGFNRIVIQEDDIYNGLKPYFDNWQVKDYVVSKFTIEEENDAKNLVYTGIWSNGYPMNDFDRSYLKTTYDDSGFCNACGMGLKQKEPFRLKKAPNWGSSKKMFSLNWVYDELFVKKEIYDSLFKNKGIKSEKVLLFKKETVIEDTVQLILPVTDVPLNLEDYFYEVCKHCNRLRYDLINKGFFPSFKENVSSVPIFKSKEWFGTGANARKYIFVSQELRKELLSIKVSPNYIPCQ